MALDESNNKNLFRYLELLSNEVVRVQKTLQSIDAQESQLRTALGELALEKDILIEQAGRLETIVKQTATSAVEDSEQQLEEQEKMLDTKKKKKSRRLVSLLTDMSVKKFI